MQCKINILIDYSFALCIRFGVFLAGHGFGVSGVAWRRGTGSGNGGLIGRAVPGLTGAFL